jgi:hypothetical protein
MVIETKPETMIEKVRWMAGINKNMTDKEISEKLTPSFIDYALTYFEKAWADKNKVFVSADAEG